MPMGHHGEYLTRNGDSGVVRIDDWLSVGPGHFRAVVPLMGPRTAIPSEPRRHSVLGPEDRAGGGHGSVCRDRIDAAGSAPGRPPPAARPR